eukprot:CAMPEP_0170507940 /NCGR_PEP_ID=MMETSP0208-20121228/60635_1 /TAXON_ID=197538 /ORGANISM="Strombidium inclinatum, Strain S3" /LENGTH=64 /DNA_ID=CAMNT_0010790493 /DNA_START=2265 /DNA_END=2459 /DNA_ORIENTATION=+
MSLQAQTPASDRRRFMANHSKQSVIDLDPKKKKVAGNIQHLNPHEHCPDLGMLDRYELEQEQYF